MSRKKRKTKDKSALDIIEEATHIIRLMPARLFAIYYAGTLPFVLGFLYFWTDMSKSALAHEHIASGAFSIAVFFVWMKSWQAVFVSELRAFISYESSERWTPLRVGRLMLTQTAMQPTGFVLLPVALLMTLPFGWTFAFYQNISFFGDGSTEGFRNVISKAWGQARLFQKQNHVFLLVVFLFGIFVFLNVTVVIIYIPHLLKSLLGVETLFTKAGWNVFNTTFLAVTLGISFLVLDPLVKTVYMLRCFYGESLHSGEDLKLELKSLLSHGSALIVILGIVFSLMGSPCRSEASAPPATEPPPAVEQAAVSAEELDAAIGKVINKREYEWRLPRVDKPEDAEKSGLIETFLRGMVETVGGWLRPVKEWVKSVADWIVEKLLSIRWPGRKRPQSEGIGSVAPDLLMYLLLTAVACTLGITLYRMWRRSRLRAEKLEVTDKAHVPDVADEGVTADEMSSDNWLRMARNLMEKGKVRLALRAFFLASLSHLAHQEFITIARFKSNRDYEYELGMKARSMPDIIEAFAQNIRIFESVWYGMHEITGESLSTFKKNLKKVTDFA